MEGEILAHLEFKLKALPGPLTDLSALGGIMHLTSREGCQISTLIFEEKLWSGRVSMNVS